MAWTVLRDECVGSLKYRIMQCTAGTASGVIFTASQIYRPTLASIDDGGAAELQEKSLRISGGNVIMSAINSGTAYNLSVYYT